jgi:hypothetical protein
MITTSRCRSDGELGERDISAAGILKKVKKKRINRSSEEEEVELAIMIMMID